MTIPSTAAPDAAAREPAAAMLEKGINGSFLIGSVRVQFDFDHALGEMTAKVRDRAGGHLIRQMHSDEAVQVAKVLGKLRGLLAQQAA